MTTLRKRAVQYEPSKSYTKDSSFSDDANDLTDSNSWSFPFAGLYVDGLAVYRLRQALALWIIFDMLYRWYLGLDYMVGSNWEDSAMIHVDDSPHGFILHQLWFYRGSALYAIFSLCAVMAVAVWYALGGTGHASRSALLLWFFLVSIHGRSDHFNDACDKLSRNLVLFTVLLGDDGWPDAAAAQRRNTTGGLLRWISPPASTTVSFLSWASAGFIIQIFIMYVAVVLNRVEQGWRFWFTEFTALEYTLLANLGVRPLGQYIANERWLCAVGTMGANVLELVLGFLLLAIPLTSWLRPAGLIGAILLHFGIAIMLALPQFQSISVLCMIGTLYFKSPMASSSATSSKKRQGRRTLRHALGAFFCIYMVYEAITDRGILPSIDHGNFGQGLRFNQYWVMFNTPRLANNWYRVTANATSTDNNETLLWDVLRGERGDGWFPMTEVEQAAIGQKPISPTSQFISWRQERLFLQTPKLSAEARNARHAQFAKRWCILAQSNAVAVEARSDIDSIRIRLYSYRTKELAPQPLWPPVLFMKEHESPWHEPKLWVDQEFKCVK